MFPSRAHQLPNSYAPLLGTYRGGDPYYSPARPGPTSSPMGFRIPYPLHQGPPSSPMGITSPYPVHQGGPNLSTPPGRGQWFNNNPIPAPLVYQGSPNFRCPPQGMSHWSYNSPSSGLGRGGGPTIVGKGRNPSSGCSGGRGRRGRRGSYDYGQARSFYNKSMVENPWESLTPVIWHGEKENDVKSFAKNRYFQKTPAFQKTPSAKRARVSNPYDPSNSKKNGSLAEYLAESFDEAVEDAATIL
ncbi:hypothetical protein SOVF_138140 [Spinacia oleracea]|nr:hypothetical protein SOVF_138140 [Spinacia oleracea]